MTKELIFVPLTAAVMLVGILLLYALGELFELISKKAREEKAMEQEKIMQTQLELGILYAAADLCRYVCDLDDVVALLKRQGLSKADCSALDEMDKEELRILRDEYGMNLRGL